VTRAPVVSEREAVYPADKTKGIRPRASHMRS